MLLRFVWIKGYANVVCLFFSMASAGQLQNLKSRAELGKELMELCVSY